MERKTFTRKELYDLVWSTPMLTLSRKFNISDVGLRKICVKNDIPLPKAGHWQRVKFGNAEPNLPLPKEKVNEKNITLPLREDTTIKMNEPSPLTILQKEIENHLQSILNVPEKLTNPDRLIVEAKEKLLKSNEDWQYKGTVSSGNGYLDIRVGKNNLSRMLRLVDTLIKSVKARGFEIQVTNQETCVVMGEFNFQLVFRERFKKEIISNDSYNNFIYKPTDKFYIQVKRYHHKEWRDGKKLLEQQISTIVAELELKAAEWKAYRIQQNKEEEERQEKIRLLKEFRQKQETELENFKHLIEDSERRHKATNLRNYIDEVEKRKEIRTQHNIENMHLDNWLNWARKKADWYDPFVEGNDELLSEVNKENLTLPKKSFSW